jgi:hypothetical protein
MREAEVQIGNSAFDLVISLTWDLISYISNHLLYKHITTSNCAGGIAFRS